MSATVYNFYCQDHELGQIHCQMKKERQCLTCRDLLAARLYSDDRGHHPPEAYAAIRDLISRSTSMMIMVDGQRRLLSPLVRNIIVSALNKCL